ncbi:MAG: enoyl-CoA hydratase [Euryarchaeota archaeon]|nr:enoyl-CoA hydratase [Euryarchaeota archaeon]
MGKKTSKMNNKTQSFEDFYIGQKASFSKKVTLDLIKSFAEISEDSNPIHLDEEIARNSVFGKRVAHGMLVASFISALISKKLPGPSSIYYEQNLSFRKPVYVNDKIKVEVVITDLVKHKRLICLSTNCYNQNNQIVISGSAKIKL